MSQLPKPKFSIETTDRSINIIADYRKSIPTTLYPLSILCDFCGRDSDRLWCRKVRPVCLETAPRHRMIYDGGHWNACVYCEPMVKERDIPLLVARILSIKREFSEMPRQFFDRMYAVIFAAMADGGPVLWMAGEKWPGE